MPCETEHSWQLTVLISISTCVYCGLLKLKTGNGDYFFVKAPGLATSCKHKYFKDFIPPEEAELKILEGEDD